MRLPASIAIKLHAAERAAGAVVRLRLGAAGRRAHPVDEAVHPGGTGTSGGGDHRPDAEAGAGLAELARTAREELTPYRRDDGGEHDVR